MKVVEGLLYAEDHEWVKVEGNVATIGLSDFAQHELGDIVFLELPEVDDELAAGDVFGVVESVKAASDSFTPVSGKVIEVNEDLLDAPEGVNSDAFGSWMYKIELSNKEELDGLMDSTKYTEFCSK
ncbi:glycine cleavage system protein GcvH [Helicovermis profundi]|uniref:Glycine cleavage system H protein n=1 Tax=Helicovermis profundi TaxID=3065157 RepID=A0AAU9E2H2_9FIRM|nr:glycine cleavage system protein GcvH [Clostridia bacterium S502]